MTTDHVVVFGMKVADPSIAWPNPSDHLMARDGWHYKTISIATNPPTDVPAMVRGELAVHRMVDSAGFSITCVPSGMRIHSRGRVFARSEHAMATAERVARLYGAWDDHAAGRTTVPREIGDEFTRLHDECERDGQILKDLVIPRG